MSLIDGMADAAPIAFLISCEHGGNRIPARYRALFHSHAHLLRTHRGADPGALRLAREMATSLHAPLLAATVSRLLVDLNRSRHHPRLFSEATRHAPAAVRAEILQDYYQPYRSKLESLVANTIAAGAQAVHVSCHSFTPELDGVVRDADIGLLYDPARRSEAAFCRRWRAEIRRNAPALRVRMNYPYAGSADGCTTWLRRRHSEQAYLGMELEVNQRHVREGGQAWRALRRVLIASLAAARDVSLQ